MRVRSRCECKEVEEEVDVCSCGEGALLEWLLSTKVDVEEEDVRR